jgi:dTDP-4-dehydrorhamnose 3,5-epimerase
VSSPNLKVTPTAIPGVLILEPRVFGDERGFFLESFNQKAFNEATGLDVHFVQDNHSRSAKGVLRGLHYQLPPHAQGKLVRVVRGSVFDVAVDIRRDSPTFGKWVGVELSEENHRQLWIPAGLAHGFLVTSESADFLYKATDYYAPAAEQCIRWDDLALQIEWPLSQGMKPIVSAKDQFGKTLREADTFPSQHLPHSVNPAH